MARNGRGGARAGTPGKAYANRSDLQQKTQPASAVPGQTYGKAGAQMQAQQAVPLPGPGAMPPVGGGMTPPAGGGAPGGATGAPPMPMPGQLGPLTAPSDRPGEPLTAGLPSGAGPGPEALSPPDPLFKVAAVLNQIGHTADPYTAALRDVVNAQLHNQGAA